MPELNPLNPAPTGKVIFDGTSYSGADIKAVVHIYKAPNKEIEILRNLVAIQRTEANPDPVTLQQIATLEARIIELQKKAQTDFTTKTLAEIQTLSVSTYREKYPVRAFSSTYPKGFTRGPRTIAGSMIFTVFDKNVLWELLGADPTEFDADKPASTAVIDQLPPFDITVSFANELGQTSRMSILGCEFVSEGQTMSIHDLFIENQCQYVARDVDPMMKTGDERKKIATEGTKYASDLLKEQSALDYKAELDPFQRFKNRSNPFK